MISGTVNARYEMRIKLPVRNSAGQEQDVEAVLDSDFTGSMTLPSSLIASLGLPWRSRTSAILANGNVEQMDVYAATIVWDGMPRSILIQAIDNVPLLGMALLVGYDLRARVTVGGVVQIEAVP
jgi:predicted aspartyl protease